ncbi:hypothetical protein LCGC14_1206010 [marine sediment metagenome]|uniref:Uncharacterized protein n=1 Tax=marine sediment metagenome TaxID=412755 RepID=A0A0F9NXQ0_9ZZZZ
MVKPRNNSVRMGSLDTENHFKHHTNGLFDHRGMEEAMDYLRSGGKNKYASVDQLKGFSLKPSDAQKLNNLFTIILY